MKRRCFLSLNMPKEAIPSLDLIISELKKKNANQPISYVKPENIHLTLHFLGYRSDEEIENISLLAGDVLKNHKPFHLRTSGFSCFPNMRNPRVLFLEGEGERDKARNIHAKLKKGLESLGIATDSRPWAIHFTLARIKSPAQLSLENNPVPEINFFVDAVYLMESVLSPHGARYTVIKKFSL